jgi:hypothetical protein
MTTIKKIKFAYPIKDFMTKYSQYFPVNTIYEVIPTKEKETVNNMFSVLLNIMKKTDKEFKKIKAFDLFKMNPYHFRNENRKIEIPDLV